MPRDGHGAAGYLQEEVVVKGAKHTLASPNENKGKFLTIRIAIQKQPDICQMCALSNLALFNEKLSSKVLSTKPCEIDIGKYM